VKPTAFATSAFKSSLASLSGRQHRGQAVFDQKHGAPAVAVTQAFEKRHYPVAYWARIWGFSAKTVCEWFRGEFGSGVLRQPNTRRRSKRDYTRIMISPSAAARVQGRPLGLEVT
jgi:hypothetical protein